MISTRITLQGPHQTAWKSTTTVCPLAVAVRRAVFHWATEVISSGADMFVYVVVVRYAPESFCRVREGGCRSNVVVEGKIERQVVADARESESWPLRKVIRQQHGPNLSAARSAGDPLPIADYVLCLDRRSNVNNDMIYEDVEQMAVNIIHCLPPEPFVSGIIGRSRVPCPRYSGIAPAYGEGEPQLVDGTVAL